MLEESEAPQVEVDTTQQTPNPAAQDPLEVPLLPEHSEEVKQVPKVEESLLLVHSSLGNWTTLNSDNCSKDILYIRDRYSATGLVYLEYLHAILRFYWDF